ncbi:hypothetical protein J1G44_20235 [Cellulomonas sp. zg-ZUI199]|uniref:SGNH hydrolase-type esterase domain-containing protein n=1 Tax=Cellulomonas wangleii TaxID=2816956 RepID=A0ABX8D7E3_9CELL|nr:hypothetical protein [Cellulomonas wangleii]MBO0926807.1 hypothetical protein [Cellulomonas wangleii]QVI63091.1 hypothetical protein KG103_04005 [Cellulomonas wangleii]
MARDTFEHVSGSGQFVLVRYVARQSLISAYAGAATVPGTEVLESPFQRRMVEGDAQGDLPSLLVAHAAETDLLVWDLTDERLGVWTWPEGQVATRSVELVASGIEEHLRGRRLVTFGTNEHFALWCRALAWFHDTVRGLSLLPKTVLLAVPWAETSDDGSAVPRSFGVAPAEANAAFERYYSAARDAGIRVVAPPIKDVVADSQHRWGPAPFHYSRCTYETIASLLEEVAPRASGSTEN